MAASLFSALPAQAGAPSPAIHPAHDVRVLIDVSGSMKKNDPANMRVPALRLLTGLLPAGTQAGVWSFGRYVNMLVPYGAVNTAWRDQAMGAAGRINSAGLYTDIEAAFETATWNWADGAPGGARRSIILLTDGLVDVSDGEDADRQSRARITDRLLPRLHASGAVVYTIALSDDADEALLQQLAAATGGGFERADSADDLERIFFRMFEKVTSPDTLPLVDNKVLVDASIEELTLLVFRREGAPATTLTLPDGKVFKQTQLPPNARWHKDARYDLVTVEKPMTGTWHVNAETDPDNRVMVVSNLRVVATQLPNQILRGDMQDFLVRFTEKDQAITKKDFLNFLKISLLESGDGIEPSERLLLDNGRDGDIATGDGIFGTRLDTTRRGGQQTVIVDVDGTTFKRQHRQTVEVVESPVIANIRTGTSGAFLSVIPRTGIINPATLDVYATITDSDSLSDSRRVIRVNPGEWQLALGDYPAGASYQLTLDIEGERLNGKPISYQGKPLHFGTPAAPAPEESEESEPGHSATDVEDTAAATSDVASADASEEAAAMDEDTEAPARTNWILVISLVFLLNAVIAGGMFLVYRKLFGAPAEPAAQDPTDETTSVRAEGKAPAASATVIDNSQPSIVSQVAAAAEAKVESVSADSPKKRADAGAEIDAATPASPAPIAAAEQPTVPAASATAGAVSHDSSPELVLEDESGQAEPDMSDARLQNLNVDEIDLGFEEPARNTG
jgi:uncharacterized protein (TIGR03503 family)